MKPSTEDLYEKYVSGYPIYKISAETGIGIWALYKRFQRLKAMELKPSQESNSEDDAIQEDTIPIANESQNRANKWLDAMSALLIFATVIAGFFLYRKYCSEKPYKKTK